MKTMTGNHLPITQQNAAKSIVLLLVLTAGLLAVPLVAMQFTHDVAWKRADIAMAIVLLVGTGLIYELVVKRARHGVIRALGGVVLAATLVFVWLELAVGIIRIAGISGT
ncbi:hypothetical protein [Massilia forsythiae]|uniref:hypothetical protein n=1 Tax=Massilia forsythiae TaxID=2728020 RepID=UPI001B7D21D1|nr:hypothetical protein [Massilia forsythiae]